MAEKRIYTPAQQSAIDERNRTLLVSAAAGSGKTAVLTERIIRSLCDATHPIDISRLLIVTFTRAAATEMRTRIAGALGAAMNEFPDNRHIARQLMLLGSAKICTIDSFYLDLVRANFEEAGLPPSFRMADENELLSLRKDIMDATVDRMYTDCSDFIKIADLFSDIRSESSLSGELLALAKKLEKAPEGYDVLLQEALIHEKTAQAPFDTKYGHAMFDTLQKTAEKGRELFECALSMIREEEDVGDVLSKKFEAAYTEIKERLDAILDAIAQKDADTVSKLTEAPLSTRVGSHKMPSCSATLVDVTEACAAFRQNWKKAIYPYGVFHRQEIAAGCMESAEILRLLHMTLSTFEKKYRAAKAEREVAEFTDVSRAAYHLLVSPDGTPTPLARSLSETYDAIYIDEYQDVDAMQDATFRAISTPRNRFMVGDIKQSIYAFRGAESTVFADYRRRFPALQNATAQDNAATIFMSNCFRCDENVVKFSNTVSSFLFSASAESIGFTDEDNLQFSKKPPYEGYVSPKCRITLIDRAVNEDEETPNDKETTDPEAHYIAAEIIRLLNEEQKADGTDIVPADIAVLVRGRASATTLTNLLKAAGISVNDTAKEGLFENPEVLCMYSLLAVIDNPFRDVYLAAVLRSPFFGFSLNDLLAVRNAADHSFSLYESLLAARDSLENTPLCARITEFLSKLDAYRQKAEFLPVDKLLRYLYRDTSVLSFTGKTEEKDASAKATQNNLLLLYEHARTFEAGGFKGLYRFVRYVEDMMENEAKTQKTASNRNAISVMTIHGSKGLEFPVCFIAATGKTFSTKDTEKQLLYNPALGCGVRVPTVGAFSRANTFCREAVSKKIKQLQIEEEMRILYVAMTRARERLYITGAPSGRTTLETLYKNVANAANPATDLYRTSGNCYLEWILTAMQRTDCTDFCEYTVKTTEEIEALPLILCKKSAETGAKNNQMTFDEAKKEFERRFDFRYPHAHVSLLPAKLSVSRLSPEVLDVYDSDAAHIDDLNEDGAQALLHGLTRVPQFEKEKRGPDAAAKGTATHTFLQFCDFERAQNDLDAELYRLIQARFLPPDIETAVRKDELRRFFKSNFYHALSDAKELHRETRFHVFLPAAEFTANEDLKRELTNEMLLVQGVIDLFYIDAQGNLVLCDYKTDRLPPDAMQDKKRAAAFLFARHGAQLAYYKKALEQICGKSPDRTVIYSLPFGEALEEPQ